MALPNEADILKKGETPDEVEVVIDGSPEVEVEVVDDTPPEDRNRKPLPEGEAEPTEEEMEQYSEAVKKRIAKMKHAHHDERRAKESAARERDEAIAVAQRLLAEKQSLENRYVQGEDAFISQAKEKADMAMANAKREYKTAYETGDADAMADAQEKMANIAMERKQTEDWAKQSTQRKETARQTPAPMVQSPQSQQVQVPEPEPEALEWAAKNKWFGENKRMTNMAYAIHDELIAEGLDPGRDTETYYKKLSAGMKETFPTYEWPDAPKKKQVTSVVAPVNRTSKTATRVTLTQSQLSVARRLGLTPQQYAVQVALLEKN